MILTYDPTQSIADSIQQVIEELNSQYTSTLNQAALPIAAYNTVTVTLQTPPWSQDVLIFSHNLGFAPLYLLFHGKLKIGGISNMPIIDTAVSGAFTGSVTSYTDNNSIYIKWTDTAQTSSQSFTYIVFNVPINPT